MTDEPSFYTLASRLLPRRSRSPGAPPALRLIPGRLPPDLPFYLPVPPDARVIGATVEGDYITILLDTERVPRQVIAFYEGELSAAAWTALDTGRSRGGFEHAAHSHATFCRTSLGPKLTVNAHAYPATLTQVRLDLDLTPDQPCGHPGGRQSPQAGPIPSLPELAPPAGAKLLKGGGEASPIGTSEHAELVTPLDLAAVAAHYAGQMREAGSIERDRGQGDLLAWSTWEVDQPDHGLSQGLVLVLQQVNDPTRYFLYLRVAWARSA